MKFVLQDTQDLMLYTLLARFIFTFEGHTTIVNNVLHLLAIYWGRGPDVLTPGVY